MNDHVQWLKDKAAKHHKDFVGSNGIAYCGHCSREWPCSEMLHELAVLNMIEGEE